MSTLSGNVLKYESTEALKFKIPDNWDVDNLSEIAVSVTDESGTVLDSGTATMWAPSTLDEAADAFDTSIVLASDVEDLTPGDYIRIGDVGEIEREVRQVIAYDDTGKEATILELRHAHADGAAVVPMSASYELDLSDTDVFTKGKSVWVRWNPDTADGEYVQQFVVQSDEFAAQGLWDEFQAAYPIEWAEAQSRDLATIERMAKRAMKRELADPKTGQGRDLDKIQDMDLMQEGLLYRCRLVVLSGVSEVDKFEKDQAQADWEAWLASVNAISIWQDDDQDQVVDSGEDFAIPMFSETCRYT